MLHCIVEDNGIGREKSQAFKEEVKNLEKKSLGMKITGARIDIINKNPRFQCLCTIYRPGRRYARRIVSSARIKFLVLLYDKSYNN